MCPHCLEVAEHNSIILYPQNLSFVRNNNEKKKKRQGLENLRKFLAISESVCANLRKVPCKRSESSGKATQEFSTFHLSMCATCLAAAFVR